MQRFTLEELDGLVNGGIIVSCQPVAGGPLDKDEIVTAMALACVDGGARALRIEGAGRVSAVRHVSEVPIIGIIKRELPGSDVRITPTVDDVEELIRAGADIIAFDSTDRVRPVSRDALVDHIIANHCLAMADCADIEDVKTACSLGAQFIGTTLSGYTSLKTPDEPDFAFLAGAVEIAPRVIAEGRYNTVSRARKAARLGAWAVTVGTALTRLETMTRWFVEGVANSHPETDNLLAYNKSREARL